MCQSSTPVTGFDYKTTLACMQVAPTRWKGEEEDTLRKGPTMNNLSFHVCYTRCIWGAPGPGPRPKALDVENYDGQSFRKSP